MLTTGVDEFTGTEKNDLFTSAVLTANDGDTLDGGEGEDILEVETAANLTDKFSATSIETVNYTALGNLSVDMKNIADATTFNNNNSTGTVTLNNIAKADMVVGVKGSTTNTIDLNYATGLLNGDADKLTVNLNGSTATTVTADSGFESVEVKTTSDSTLNTLTAANATALTLSGNADLTLGTDAVNTFSDYTVTNSGKVTYNNITSVKTFDASTNTGGIVGADLVDSANLNNGTSQDVLTMSSSANLIQTGSGNDNISVNSSALLSTSNAVIKLGAGNDVLAVTPGNSGEYIYGEAGDDVIYINGNLGASDLLDGGAGTDTVNFVANTTSNFIAKGIEKVGVQSASLGTDSVSFVTIDSAVDITDSGAGATSFTGLKNGSTYTSTVKKAAATDDITLNFATGEAATINVDLTKGAADTDITTTNAKDVTVTYGAASAKTGVITLDKAATSLTINATGALGDGTQAIAGSATAANQKLATITAAGNKSVELGNVTNAESITNVSVTAADGKATIGNLEAAAAGTSDLTVSSIAVSATKGEAKIGDIDFAGKATTVTGKIETISATSTGTSSAATTIGAIEADTLGTVTATSAKHDATIGAINVGDDTDDTTDGTISALKASAFKDATITSVTADKVDSIVVESTDTVTGGDAELGALASTGAATDEITVGTIDISSKKGAAAITDAVTADALGNTTITGGSTAGTKAITVDNATDDSVTGNITVTAGTNANLDGDITLEKAGTIAVKAGGTIEYDSITVADTAGQTITMEAGSTITGKASNTISNTAGDLSFTAKAETNFVVVTKTTIQAGDASNKTDIDLLVDLQNVKGNAGSGTASEFVIDNKGADANSSTTVKAAQGENDLTITGAANSTITFNGNNGVDTVILSGDYASSIITTENGADIITSGKGNDSINLSETVAAIDTVIFAATATANGEDTITNFHAGNAAAKGDVLDFTNITLAKVLTDTGTAVTATGTPITAFTGGADTDLADSVFIWEGTKDELATEIVTATGSTQAFLANGAKAVALLGTIADGETTYDAYYITGTDNNTETIELVGKVTVDDGDALDFANFA